MKFGKVRSPQLSTSELLEVDVTFFVIGRTLGNLIPKVMKAYSWGTPQIVVLIEFSIKRTKTVMESINVVIDDEEVEAPREGRKIDPFLLNCLSLQLTL
jgi:hypothetical protein